MFWEELRGSGHNWKGMRQTDDELREPSGKAVTFRSISYRQNFCWGPIAVHFL